MHVVYGYMRIQFALCIGLCTPITEKETAYVAEFNSLSLVAIPSPQFA